MVSTKPGAPSHFYRYNSARTGVDPSGATRGKGYEEYEKHEVKTGIENWKPEHFAFDATGFYVTGESSWVVALGLDGKPRWRYHFLDSPGERGLLPPLLDEAHAYVIHPSGEVVAFDKANGELRWLLPLKADIVANPFFWGSLIVLPTKGKQGIELVFVSRSNGKPVAENPRLDIKPGFQVAHANDDVLIVTVDTKVIAIDPENWAVAWSQTMTEPLRPDPAVIFDNDVFVTTLGGKLLKLDIARKGKVDWEIQLEKPAAAPPTVMPIMGRLAIVDTSGALSTVDIKTGKVYWRYGIDSKGIVMDPWASRLSAKHIEENKMDWLHKGWTIWAMCGERRACFYTPLKGLLINRLNLAGEPMALPLLIPGRLVFFTKVKDGQYVISHQVDDGEMKRIRKEAAEKAQSAASSSESTSP